MDAAAVTTRGFGERPSEGICRDGRNFANCDINANRTRSPRRGSKRTQEKLDALARIRPDLLDDVRAGRLRAKTAAREAGTGSGPVGRTAPLIDWFAGVVSLRIPAGLFDISLATLDKAVRISRAHAFVAHAVQLRPFIAGLVTGAILSALIAAKGPLLGKGRRSKDE